MVALLAKEGMQFCLEIVIFQAFCTVIHARHRYGVHRPAMRVPRERQPGRFGHALVKLETTNEGNEVPEQKDIQDGQLVGVRIGRHAFSIIRVKMERNRASQEISMACRQRGGLLADHCLTRWV